VQQIYLIKGKTQADTKRKNLYAPDTKTHTNITNARGSSAASLPWGVKIRAPRTTPEYLALPLNGIE
jgi:hypothetical protein